MNKKFVIRDYIYYLEGEEKPYSGDYAEYWSTTDVLAESFYLSDGKIEGIYKSDHENGVLAEVGFYKDGKANGHFKRYYSDGQLEADVHYRDDKFDGYCEFFKPDGTLDDTILYSMDSVLETIKL